MAINYFSMRISEQRMRVYQASVAAYTRSVEIVQNQLDAGIVSRVDLAQAQAQLEQTRAQLVAENITRATFEHAVAVLAGKAPSQLSVAPGPLPPQVPTVEPGIPSRCSSGGPTSPRRAPDGAANARSRGRRAYYPSSRRQPVTWSAAA